MSMEYDAYLADHRENVKKGFCWLKEHFPLLIGDDEFFTRIPANHDVTKLDREEYRAYDAYFYGGNRSHGVVKDFHRAWLMHIHKNPHHWQYWVLINDDPQLGEQILEMDYECVIEMICDWWSFSWANGDLNLIFGWWDEHKAYMKLHPNTRALIALILDRMKEALNDVGPTV